MTSSVTCPRAHPVGWEAGARFCPECGDGLLSCPHGHPVEGATRFCPTCGTALEPVGTAAESPPTEPAVPAVSAGTSPGPSFADAAGIAPSSDPLGPWDPSPHRRWPRVLAVTAIVLVAGGGAFAAVRLLHPASSSKRAEDNTPTTTPFRRSVPPPRTHPRPPRNIRSSVTPSSTTTTVAPASQEARALVPLLARSAQDFNEVQQATTDLGNGCSTLQQDEQMLNASAQDRRALATQVQGLDLSALPNGAAMQQDLITAWTSSATSDASYAQAAAYAMTQGCADVSQDPAYEAPTDSGSDRQSTAAKQAFVGLWDPIAQRYGLSQYQANQL